MEDLETLSFVEMLHGFLKIALGAELIRHCMELAGWLLVIADLEMLNWASDCVSWYHCRYVVAWSGVCHSLRCWWVLMRELSNNLIHRRQLPHRILLSQIVLHPPLIMHRWSICLHRATQLLFIHLIPSEHTLIYQQLSAMRSLIHVDTLAALLTDEKTSFSLLEFLLIAGGHWSASQPVIVKILGSCGACWVF